VSGRLFNNLQKRIEALGGNHVGLIQDEDLEAIARWCKDCSFSKVPGIIYTVVRGSINFNYIQRTRTTLCQLNTAVTLSAWRISWSLCAI
jgi:hypothetical protein